MYLAKGLQCSDALLETSPAAFFFFPLTIHVHSRGNALPSPPASPCLLDDYWIPSSREPASINQPNMDEDFAAQQRIDTAPPPVQPIASTSTASKPVLRTFAPPAKLEPFLLLAKSARGAGAASLIDQATSASGVFVFAELLECRCIAEVRHPSRASLDRHDASPSMQSCNIRARERLMRSMHVTFTTQ